MLNRQDAEDVSQEVFIEIYHSIKNFRGDSSLNTWIYRIAISKSLDELKRMNRKKRVSAFGKAIGLEKVVEYLVGSDRPDQMLEEYEGMHLLLNELNNLPESQRVALTLSKIEEHSNSEIAEIMQTSLTAVDSLIYRAKQNLRKKFYR